MASATRQASRRKKKQGAIPASKNGGLTAATADRHELYQFSVQNVETEIDFVDAEFERLRGRKAELLRE
ncbi:MAG: class I SAM-dependent methyltransferase, partial [Planctomycetota bacterium]